MPQIIVTADRGADFGDGAVTFRERVTVADFESGHFARQLVERIGWAVGDADAVEHVEDPAETTYDPGEPVDREPVESIYDPSEPSEREPVESIYDPSEPADRVSAPSPA